jgi:hypothetical protein
MQPDSAPQIMTATPPEIWSTNPIFFRSVTVHSTTASVGLDDLVRRQQMRRAGGTRGGPGAPPAATS